MGRIGSPPRSPWWGRINAPLLAAVGVTAMSALLVGGHAAGAFEIPELEDWERLAVDARFRLRGERAPLDDRIVIVGIDERSRLETDIMQSRRGWAELLDALATYEPKVVGVDAFFSRPEVNLSRATVNAVRKAAKGLAAGETPLSPAAAAALAALSAVLEETRGDELLAASIAAAGNVYLGILFYLDEDDPLPPGAAEPAGVALARYGESVFTEQPPSRRPPRGEQAVTTSLGPMTAGAAGAGFVNVDTADDGSVRTIPLVIEHGGRYYMPLAMSLALAALEGGAVSAYVAGARKVHVGDGTHPVTGTGRALLSFLGARETFPHVSAADVVSGTAPRSALAEKLVLIGYTDVARDVVATPFDPRLRGVELHATLLHNLLHGELMRRAGPYTTVLAILLLGGLLSLLQLRRIRHGRAWLGGVAGLLFLGGHLLLAQLLFSGPGLVIDVVAPGLAISLIAASSLTAAAATEGRERSLLRSIFSQYVQGTVVDRILDDPRRARLGGVRRDLTVLFADIRGFSAISEKLEPEELSDYLNQYFTPLTDLILAQGGMLDKYIGDALMAVFGAPLEQPDHAERACRSALEALDALAALNESWRSQGFAHRVSIGIGINSGPMAVGNMGSERRFDYTVIGDAVNLGARLETLTREYQVQILVGEETAAAAGDAFLFRELDMVRVKGRAGTVRVYELAGTRERPRFIPEELRLFQEALSAYRRRDWDRAEEILAAFLKARPDDGPAAVLQARVRRLRADPPRADWDGVFVQLTK